METQRNSKHYRRAHVHIDIYIDLYIREGVCQNLSFQNMFGGNFRMEKLVPVYIFQIFSIHVKMCVLLTYSAVKWVYMMCSNALSSRGKPAVSPISGSPQSCSDIDKKKTETGQI